MSHTIVSVPLQISSPIAVADGVQPITFGVPFPKGQVTDPFAIVLDHAAGQAVPTQVSQLTRWSDGSVRWLLVDLLSPALPAGTCEWTLHVVQGPADENTCGIKLEQRGDELVVHTGASEFHLDTSVFCPLGQMRPGITDSAGAPLSSVVLSDAKGRPHAARVEHFCTETDGPVRTTLVWAGRFDGRRGLRFRARACFFADTGLVRLRFTIHNPNRARHPGGLWDLGDAGSFFFRDLSLEIGPENGRPGHIFWSAESQQELRPLAGPRLEIYQDSSGGANWASTNHVNRDGRVPCRFRGYRVRSSDGEQLGHRASPTVMWHDGQRWLAIAVPEFWQQFPKAIEVEAGRLRIRLFPAQWDDLFELQGGEQKTHTVWLRYEAGGTVPMDCLTWTHAPACICARPEWYACADAIPYLAPASSDPDGRLRSLMDQAMRGEKSFFAGREVIDEYGWRNFGEVWANHEEVYYQGPKPIISHYNNQFDVIDGAIRQLMRTGDSLWFEFLDPLARHVMDIDIYHTQQDKSAYNGGMFWHTDHYRDAATSSHRTYSRVNLHDNGQPYGGGPGPQHNYATGLLHYYYLTGDRDARESVLGLANWVLDMDDGAQNILGIIDEGPTGLAGTCADRGSANSLNVLLDAWLLSDQSQYRAKAEELIRRCIHPTDDIEALNLLDAEHHWFYTMFLSALARYLDIKSERGDLDKCYAYAQRSLLHYAHWMAAKERPYLDHPEELEYPTETWAAQDFRKANVLQLAARHADHLLAEVLRARAGELAERAWSDLLGFPTSAVSRALVLMMSEGSLDCYFRTVPLVPAAVCPEANEFGLPSGIVGQKQRVVAQLKTMRGLLHALGRFFQPTVWRRSIGLLKRRYGSRK